MWCVCVCELNAAVGDKALLSAHRAEVSVCVRDALTSRSLLTLTSLYLLLCSASLTLQLRDVFKWSWADAVVLKSSFELVEICFADQQRGLLMFLSCYVRFIYSVLSASVHLFSVCVLLTSATCILRERGANQE